MTFNATSSIVAGGLALLMTPALATTAFADTRNHALVDPTVTIFNQKAQGQTVSVSYAHLPKPGYIVIYGSDASGKPTGDPLGSIALKAGDHRDFKVELKAAPAPETKLWAAMYEDKDGDAKLDKSKDVAFWPGGKLPWENNFQIQ
jgi:hypothetical protein